MPIFEYQCTGCQQAFELLVRNGEQVRCPECRSEHVEKLLSTPTARSGGVAALPITSDCAPEGPPCRPNCCRLP